MKTQQYWHSKVSRLMGRTVENVRLGQISYVRLLAACSGKQASADTILCREWQQELFRQAVAAITSLFKSQAGLNYQQMETVIFDVLHQTKLRRLAYIKEEVKKMRKACADLRTRAGVRNRIMLPVGTILYSRPQTATKQTVAAIVLPGTAKPILILNGCQAGKNFATPTEAYKTAIGKNTRDYGWRSWYYCPFHIGSGRLSQPQIDSITRVVTPNREKKEHPFDTNVDHKFVVECCLPMGFYLPWFDSVVQGLSMPVMLYVCGQIPATTLEVMTIKKTASGSLYTQQPDGSYKPVNDRDIPYLLAEAMVNNAKR